MSHDEIKNFFNGCGYEPIFVEGSDPMTMHHIMARALDRCIEKIKSIWKDARENGSTKRSIWPMIIYVHLRVGQDQR